MAATGNKVFISYRREDAVDIAGRIRDWLIRVQRISKDDVFMDVTTLLPGADFVQVIEDTIGQCRAMIVVISPSWLAQVNAPDSSYVRVEAETALRLDVPVIPVLVGGAQMPSAEQLPEGLRPLMRRNVRAVRSTDFDYDMEWVGRALGSETAEQTQVAVPSIPPVSRNPGRSPIIIAGAVVLLLAIVFVTLASLRGGGSTGGNGGGTGNVSDTRPPQATRDATATATAAATSSPAATFSPTPTATASPTPLAFDTQPYYAQVPGPCDTGGARWESSANTSYQCLSDGLQLSGNGDAIFYGTTGRLPLNLSVEVGVTSLHGVVSLLVAYPNGTEYFLQIQATGAWLVYGIGPQQTIGSGATTASSSYILGITTNGTTKSFYLNSIKIASVDDGLKGNYLSAGFGSGANSTAKFSSFQFAPQS